MGKPESRSSRSSVFSNPFRSRPSAAPSNSSLLPNNNTPSVPTTNSSLAPPPSYTEATRSVDFPAQPDSTPLIVEPPSSDKTQAHPRLTRDAASTKDDPYAFLSSFDTVFLIDDSGSMYGSNWDETRAVLEAIVPICTEHDEDGVDVYFLNHKTSDEGDALKGAAGTGYRGIKKSQDVQDLFKRVSPNGGTPTAMRMRSILNTYLKLYTQRVQETGDETILRPLNLIIITDGAPNDEPEDEIVRVAKKLDALDAPMYQIGVQFFQVGNDPQATAALRNMDDDLTNKHPGMRDMVDTSTFDDSPGTTKPGTSLFRSSKKKATVLSSDAVLKVVLGAVVRRLDRVATRQS